MLTQGRPWETKRLFSTDKKQGPWRVLLYQVGLGRVLLGFSIILFTLIALVLRGTEKHLKGSSVSDRKVNDKLAGELSSMRGSLSLVISVLLHVVWFFGLN